MEDFKNHQQADLELKRQRRKYELLGQTDMTREHAKCAVETKKSWAEVIQGGVRDRDGYIPLRYGMFFGTE